MAASERQHSRRHDCRRRARNALAARTLLPSARPQPAFSQFKPWFDEINALVEEGEFERFDEVYDLIEGALTLESPSGPVAEFLLHIDQERAWFRWSEGSATS
ncbi:hypothetical protein AB0N81_40285 [Streptomyces sp. NPDC093510]|uniref:hypothetical protein n=1 Tax=Streptomyces sp. NPDC093510 TaxID=3155199 RepID=UPI00342FF212